MAIARRSAWTSSLLDGVNAAALGLMAGVLLQLGDAAVVDIPALLLAIVAAVVLFVTRVNSAWLIAAGAAAGLALQSI